MSSVFFYHLTLALKVLLFVSRHVIKDTCAQGAAFFKVDVALLAFGPTFDVNRLLIFEGLIFGEGRPVGHIAD